MKRQLPKNKTFKSLVEIAHLHGMTLVTLKYEDSKPASTCHVLLHHSLLHTGRNNQKTDFQS